MTIRLGLQLWNQVFGWAEARDAAIRGEALGYDELWIWEHALACMGSPDQDTFDAYTLLTAWSQVTSRVRLGVLTGANTFWNPGLLAKKVTTLDHVSRGRAILGLGAGWFEPEHVVFGIDFGTGFRDRLAWLDESAGVLRELLEGETVTYPEGGRWGGGSHGTMVVDVTVGRTVVEGGGAVVVAGCTELQAATKDRAGSQVRLYTIDVTFAPLTRAG